MDVEGAAAIFDRGGGRLAVAFRDQRVGARREDWGLFEGWFCGGVWVAVGVELLQDQILAEDLARYRRWVRFGQVRNVVVADWKKNWGYRG